MLTGLEPFVELMDKLKEVGREYIAYNEIRTQLNHDIQEMGYPILNSWSLRF